MHSPHITTISIQTINVKFLTLEIRLQHFRDRLEAMLNKVGN